MAQTLPLADHPRSGEVRAYITGMIWELATMARLAGQVELGEQLLSIVCGRESAGLSIAGNDDLADIRMQTR